MRFLIVDDEATARTVLRESIKKTMPGCEIIEAENGADAIYHFLHSQPDMVLLDLIMPVVNGEVFLDVIEECAEKGLIKQEPRVVVITSFNDATKLMELSSRPSVEKVIPKPITQATITMLKSIVR